MREREEAAMVLFELFTQRFASVNGQAPGQELPEAVRHALPRRFEAVGEALMSERGTIAACTVVGGDVARDGAALGEALDGLRATYRLVKEAAPDFEAAQALSVAWAEATLEYLHQLSCEDPLTGLASLAHVRTRLSELYRDAERSGRSVQTSHALVIIEMAFVGPLNPAEHPFTRALNLVRLCESTRAVFSGGETIGRLGLDTAVVVVRRENDLGTSVALLRKWLAGPDLDSRHTRVWIEGLPATADSATCLLDELAR